MVEPRPDHALIILNKHSAPPWLSNHEHFFVFLLPPALVFIVSPVNPGPSQEPFALK